MVAIDGEKHTSVKTYYSEALVRTLMMGESFINSPETRHISFLYLFLYGILKVNK